MTPCPGFPPNQGSQPNRLKSVEFKYVVLQWADACKVEYVSQGTKTRRCLFLLALHHHHQSSVSEDNTRIMPLLWTVYPKLFCP